MPPAPTPAQFLDAIRELSAQFVDEAQRVPADAALWSVLWPTPGDMVDHLGQIQRWSAHVVRTAGPADRGAFARPADREPIAWMSESSADLVAALEDAGPDAAAWTFVGPGTASFWFRRQAHEARKHLWDIRTGVDPAPLLPSAGGPAMAADVIDELFEVFLARSRRAGQLPPLPGPLRLAATGAAVAWTITVDWETTRDAAADPAATVLRAGVADLALFAWDRVIPEELPARFTITGDPGVIAAYRDAPVHP